MPAHPASYVAKLVSADQLVKYQAVTDGRIHDQIVNRYVMPLRATAGRLDDPLDSMNVRQRVYRVYDSTFDDRLRVRIVTYKEVL